MSSIAGRARAARWTGALALALALAGCGAGVNPANWFGGASEGETIRLREAPLTEDARPLVDQVAQLSLERAPGGAIVTATGLPPTLGYWNAALLPSRTGVDGRPVPEDGSIALRFVALPPPTLQPVGSAEARQITAGLFLSDQTLQDVRSIVVIGARNQRAVRN